MNKAINNQLNALYQQGFETTPLTPEQVGSLLHDAKKIIAPPAWDEVDKLRWAREKCEQVTARRILRENFPRFDEILALELQPQ